MWSALESNLPVASESSCKSSLFRNICQYLLEISSTWSIFWRKVQIVIMLEMQKAVSVSKPSVKGWVSEVQILGLTTGSHVLSWSLGCWLFSCIHTSVSSLEVSSHSLQWFTANNHERLYRELGAVTDLCKYFD